MTRYRSKNPEARDRQSALFRQILGKPSRRRVRPFRVIALDGATVLAEGDRADDAALLVLTLGKGAFAAPREVPLIAPLTWRARTRALETVEMERAERRRTTNG